MRKIEKEGEFMMATRRILIPQDRTEYSKKILPLIEKLIPPLGTELILFHVADPPVGVGVSKPDYALDFMLASRIVTRESKSPAQPIYASQIEEALQNRIIDELRDETRRLEEAGYQVSVLVHFGRPVEEILGAITQWQVDLIAMTTHAREGFSRLIFGSVAEKVLHEVNIPVLLVHPTQRIAYEPFGGSAS